MHPDDTKDSEVPVPIHAIKVLRVAIDGDIRHIQVVANEHIGLGPGGRELALAITKLQEAKMWAGMALGELGHKLPEEYRDEAQ
jgi:hypothetical protein